MSKKKPKPTVTSNEMCCIKCGLSDNIFLMCSEIYNKTTILQWCKKCNRTMEFRLKELSK